MTMRDAFAHLHVASGFSLRYGASTPAALVERAASLGQPALALTDRDGLYGAVRFVQACDEAGIAPGRTGATSACTTGTGRSSLNPLPCNGIGSLGAHRQIHAERRGDACFVASLHKAHCAVESVAIGQGERGLAQ